MRPEDHGRDRMAVEQAKLRHFFPAFQLVGRDGKVVGVIGDLQPVAGGPSYRVRLTLPRGYPYDMPQVHAVSWEPTPRTPHQYDETWLCVMHPRYWSSNYTLAYLVAKTALWCGKYEVWRQHGRWPGRNQHGDEYPRPDEVSEGDGDGFWASLGELFR